MRKPYFSFNDFKDWLSQRDDVKDFFEIDMSKNDVMEDAATGKVVTPLVGRKKLAARMHVEEGEAESILDEFLESGGTVLDVSGKRVLVEVDAGLFYVPRFCVEISD